jgi:hypothetical protein
MSERGRLHICYACACKRGEKKQERREKIGEEEERDMERRGEREREKSEFKLHDWKISFLVISD